MTNAATFVHEVESLVDPNRIVALNQFAEMQSQSYVEFMKGYIRGEYPHKVPPPKPDTFDEDLLLAPRPPTNWERERKRHTFYTRLQNGDWKSPAMKASLAQVIALAKNIFHVPMVASSLITADEWMNQCSTENLNLFTRANRDMTLCGHAILRQDRRPLVILDAASDWRFQNYPQIKSGMIQFYAGIPLVSNAQNLIRSHHQDGDANELRDDVPPSYAIGTLCIMDAKPRESFTAEEEQMLQYLGSLIMTIIDAHLCDAHVLEQQRKLQCLAEFVRVPSQTNTVTVTSRFSDMNQMVERACQEIIACLGQNFQCQFFVTRENCDNERMKEQALERDCIVSTIYTTPSSVDSSIHGYYLLSGKTNEMILTQDDQNSLDLFANASTTFLQDIIVHRANKSKTIFLDSMSHELRTPAHGMTATIELALENKDLPPDVLSLLKMAQISGKGMHNVLNHLLDFKKMENNIVDRGVLEWINLDTTLQDLLDGYATLLKPRVELRFVNELPFRLSHCDVNMEMFRSACDEVISNAIKFTDAGLVTVAIACIATATEAVRDKIHLKLTVCDTGRGMTAEFVEHDLYTAFCKEDTFVQGAGLGMVLAKQYAAVLTDGMLRVEESTPNLGTTFSLAFTSTEDGDDEDEDDGKERGIYIDESERWEKLRLEVRPQIIINDDRYDQDYEEEVRIKYRAFYEVAYNVDDYQTAAKESQEHIRKPFLVHIVDTRSEAVFTPNVLNATDAEREIQRLGMRYHEKGGGCVIVIVDCSTLLTYAMVAEKYNEVVTITCAPFGRTRACSLMYQAAVMEHNARKARKVKDIKRLQLQRELQASPDHVGILAAKNIFALVVDDNAVNVNVLSAFLRKRQIAHCTAVDGLLAIKQFKEQKGRINLVLMDLNMPNMDGMEAVREIRKLEDKDPELYGVSKVVMLTGIADVKTKKKALNEGCSLFYSKPVKLRDIDTIIKAWFEDDDVQE